jgi:S-phase kinase-associated protein 1
MVKLISSDNEKVTVSKEVAERSVLLKNMMEDIGSEEDAEIPLPNVTMRVLKKVWLPLSLHGFIPYQWAQPG